MLSFDDVWIERLAVRRARERAVAGQLVLGEGTHLASELVTNNPSTIVSAGTIVLDVPLPSVRQVFFTYFVFEGGPGVVGDPAGLPGLEVLYSDGRLPQALDAASVRDLAVAFSSDVARVGARELDRLMVERAADPEHLHLPGLRWLTARPARAAASVLAPLEGLERLRLLMDCASLTNLRRVGSKSLVTHGGFFWGGLGALDGIERWERLRELTLHATGVSTLDPLAESGVERLRVQSAGRAVDLRALGRMATLREVELDGTATVEDFGDWSGAVSVETVRLGETPLAGCALDGLALAPGLRDVWVHARNGEAAQRLMAARPEVAVHVWGDAVRPGEITVGPLHAIPVEDEWCVLQDLCDLLGTATNYDAEAKIRGALPKALLTRCSFDTEAGGVSIAVPDRETLTELAAAVAALADESGLPGPRGSAS